MNTQLIRDTFPAIHDKIYFMSGAIGPIPEPVLSYQVYWLEKLQKEGALIDPYFFELIENTRSICAKFLNTDSDRIAFSANTSTNMNYLAMLLKEITPKKKIISLKDEFPSTTLPYEHHGFEIDFIESQNGLVNEDDIVERIDSNTAAVVLSHVQFRTGFRADINSLGEKLKKRGVPFIINATQSIGAFVIDLKRCEPFALVASTHKWLCAGFCGSILYIDSSYQNRPSPLIGWISAKEIWELENSAPEYKNLPMALELGTTNITNFAGIYAAIKHTMDLGIDNISTKILENKNYLNKRLKERKNIKVLSYFDSNISHIENHNSGTTSFQIEGNSDQIYESLKKEKIFTNMRRGAIRVSTHYFNTSNEIDRLLEFI
jgi:selenocysteine lyase/cysteine desulfurase